MRGRGAARPLPVVTMRIGESVPTRVQKDRQKPENVTGIASPVALHLLQIRSLLMRSF
jgi:hypothetical protein